MIKKAIFPILLFVVVVSMLKGQNYDWKQQTINYVKVDSITYYFPSNISIEDRVKIIDDCKKDIKANLMILNEKEYNKAIDVVFVNTRKEILRYTGQQGRGVAYYFRNAVFSLTNQNDSPIKHEMMHMMSAELWGIPANSSLWIYEGIATLSGGYCSNYTLDEVYQYYLQSGKVIGIDSLAHNFRNYNDVITYTESAFLTKYLMDNYGYDKLKKLWAKGLESFKEIYGFSVNGLEEKLVSEFKIKYPKKIAFDWEEFNKGCN